MIRCNCCGRFISFADIQDGKVKQTYIPLSDYSTEEFLFHCVRHSDTEPVSSQSFYPRT